MATTKFNNIILDMARILKAARTLATDDAGSYTSALLARYANRAIREFLIERLVTLTPFQFAEAYPEYIKESGAITLVSGVVAKPFDSIYIIEVRQGNVRFSRVQQKDVEGMITGMNRTMVPSATKPFFWEENGSIHTLGITTGNITVRYIVVHQDIAPSNASAGDGKYGTNVTGTIYTVATKTLAAATMSAAFSVSDINKRIMFLGSDGTVRVYYGRIASYVSATSVILTGDGLPLTSFGATDITAVLVSDNDITDLILNEYWHPEIVQRCVQMALADAKNVQLS